MKFAPLIVDFSLLCLTACASSHIPPASSPSAAAAIQSPVVTSHYQSTGSTSIQSHAPPARGQPSATAVSAICETAREQIELTTARLQSTRSADWGTPREYVSKQIQLLNELIAWWDRCPDESRSLLPPKAELVEQCAELRNQLAALGSDVKPR